MAFVEDITVQALIRKFTMEYIFCLLAKTFFGIPFVLHYHKLSC